VALKPCSVVSPAVRSVAAVAPDVDLLTRVEASLVAPLAAVVAREVGLVELSVVAAAVSRVTPLVASLARLDASLAFVLVSAVGLVEFCVDCSAVVRVAPLEAALPRVDVSLVASVTALEPAAVGAVELR
jgi:hypothetical protein